MRRPAGDPQQIAAACDLHQPWRPVAGIERRVDPLQHHDRPHRLTADTLVHLPDPLLEIGDDLLGLRLAIRQPADEANVLEDVGELLRLQ